MFSNGNNPNNKRELRRDIVTEDLIFKGNHVKVEAKIFSFTPYFRVLLIGKYRPLFLSVSGTDGL